MFDFIEALIIAVMVLIFVGFLTLVFVIAWALSVWIGDQIDKIWKV